MSKANSNFDHLVRDKYGHKKIEGTYYAINKLEERIEKLENLIKKRIIGQDEAISKIVKSNQNIKFKFK